MLLGLKIENIAVIEKAEIEFSSGLNVLTGETGAGKSIIIDSINAILGERTSKELIRDGKDSAKVTAVFAGVNSAVLGLLDEYDIEKTEDGCLTISRVISLSGKNSCKVNGYPVTVSQLKDIGVSLINIHGQHDSQALLSPDKHCGFIDALAENSKLLSDYRSAFSTLIKVKHELDSLYDSRDNNAQRLDYLEFVITEIDKANIRIGETDELNKEKNLLENSVKVQKLLDRTYSSLGSDGGISESLADCSKDLETAAGYYDEAIETAKQLKSLSFDLIEITSAVKSLSERFTYSPERLKEINERLDEIYRLSMKYGKNEEEILVFYDKCIEERDEIGNCDDRIKELESELFKNSDKVKSLSKKLTKSRTDAAAKFEKKVIEQLKYLDMPYVDFKVDIKPVPLSVKGAENIEFLISTNPGQAPKPISKVASGGELSRIMLAIKNVLSSKDITDTLIFDEIDTGVSGSAAEKIALKLHSVSEGRQVICVTHLARIAAQADNHLKITKEVKKGVTYTRVTNLDDSGRAQELARITAGNSVTELQLKSAAEMLKKVREKK
jgi:DNA repair protein RecN (Recombination protein N)